MAVALFAGKSGREDAGGVEVIVAGERGNQLATAAAGLEFPSVVAAGDAIAVEPTFAEWNPAMGTAVAHGEDATVGAAAKHQRNPSSIAVDQLSPAQRVCAEGGIPVVVEEGGAGALDRHSCFGCGDQRHVEQK